MEFTLTSSYIELCDLLKLTRLTSTGGEAKIHIANGEVKVNGAQETRKRCKLKSGDVVEFNNQKITIK